MIQSIQIAYLPQHALKRMLFKVLPYRMFTQQPIFWWKMEPGFYRCTSAKNIRFEKLLQNSGSATLPLSSVWMFFKSSFRKIKTNSFKPEGTRFCIFGGFKKNFPIWFPKSLFLDIGVWRIKNTVRKWGLKPCSCWIPTTPFPGYPVAPRRCTFLENWLLNACTAGTNTSFPTKWQ